MEGNSKKHTGVIGQSGVVLGQAAGAGWEHRLPGSIPDLLMENLHFHEIPRCFRATHLKFEKH